MCLLSDPYLSVLHSFYYLCFLCAADHLCLHVLSHSCPTRRSSDLPAGAGFEHHQPQLREAVEGGVIEEGGEGVAHALGRGYGHQQALRRLRSEEHTSELPSLMRLSYAVFCLKQNTITNAQLACRIPHQQQK